MAISRSFRRRTLHSMVVVASLAALPLALLSADAQAVSWTNAVNVSIVNGRLLQKTSGCDGCQDGGAVSQQSLVQGDGYVEFTVGEANTLWAAGFARANAGTTYADIDFAFRFNGGGGADVIENGIYQGGDTSYAPGDVFPVAVVAGRIEYSRNGVVLHESPTAPQYPLILDASLLTIGATVVNARIGVTNPPPVEPPPPYGGFLEKAGAQTY